MDYKILQPKKPETIALSFSGGGFRAASFCLGCLSYMEKVRLGEQSFMSAVEFISSASGGTITNLSYIQSQRNGHSFKEYYSFMHEEILQGEKLLDHVFSIMTDKKRWQERPSKSRNLINAFAIAYDDLLFKKENFGIFFKGGQGVYEVCANTTDFDNGILFRFQNRPKYGNHFLFFTSKGEEALRQIKLGDILAASSCFPVGFEPIMFPRDFAHSQLSEDMLEKAVYENPAYQSGRGPNGKLNVGFMDGGIDDNQGIASFMLAEERLRDRNSFGYDLYMACDVSSNYTSGFEFPTENKKSFLLKPSIGQYLMIFIFIFLACVACIMTGCWTSAAYAIGSISGLLLALGVIVAIKGAGAHNKAKKDKETYALTVFPRIGLFLRLKLSVIMVLLMARMKSSGYLAAVVFLKKIRRSSYDRLFEAISERKYSTAGKRLDNQVDDSLVERVELKHWRKFSLQNAVYLLCRKNDGQRMMTLKKEPWFKQNPVIEVDGNNYEVVQLMEPSEDLQKVAELATEMDTTLWYDRNHMADNRHPALVATGQFTTCYNLLRFALRFDGVDPYWGDMQRNLAKEWLAFRDKPYWLYNEYGNDIKDFKAL